MEQGPVSGTANVRSNLLGTRDSQLSEATREQQTSQRIRGSGSGGLSGRHLQPSPAQRRAFRSDELPARQGCRARRGAVGSRVPP